MDVEQIRKLRLADPFRPFRLILGDGRNLPVERPSFLSISPKGGTVVHSSLRGGFEFVRVDQIRDAVVDESLRATSESMQ
jgi:hypothetical protein